MNVIRTLWASIQGSPVFMRKVNGWLTVLWILMIPVSIATGWIHSVAYISALSLWALVSGHWSAWQAARVEVAQERQQKDLEENPPEERVVEAIVRETTIDKLEDVEAAAHNGANGRRTGSTRTRQSHRTTTTTKRRTS